MDLFILLNAHLHFTMRQKMFLTKKQAQLLLLAAAVLMILFGMWRGEADTVFSKAIRLCMECVGIG